MSEFIKHAPCPECGSRDNCAIYSDGHEWCFGCGYYKPSVGWKKIIKNERKPNSSIYLPSDSSDNLSLIAQEWYRRYKITDIEAGIHKFKWSQEKQWLIMPVYNASGDLLLYQAKTFNTGPKYFTKGSPSQVDHILGNTANPILFAVEDMLSAIKLSRIATVICLFGSEAGPEKLLRLSKLYDTIVVWLDRDKARAALKLRQRAKNVFRKAFCVSNLYDPKCLSMLDLEFAMKGY